MSSLFDRSDDDSTSCSENTTNTDDDVRSPNYDGSDDGDELHISGSGLFNSSTERICAKSHNLEVSDSDPELLLDSSSSLLLS